MLNISYQDLKNKMLIDDYNKALHINKNNKMHLIK